MAFEKYPLRIVFFSNLLSFLIYALGIMIIQRIGWIYAGLYIAYLIILEIRLLKFHCPNCYYYGKVCAFGKGIISSLFFKKGEPVRFSCEKFTYKDLIPDILVFIIPAISAIVLLILKFDWFILSSLVILVFLNFSGNAYVRGQHACKNCKQKELGCPAIDFFERSK